MALDLLQRSDLALTFLPGPQDEWGQMQPGNMVWVVFHWGMLKLVFKFILETHVKSVIKLFPLNSNENLGLYSVVFVNSCKRHSITTVISDSPTIQRGHNVFTEEMAEIRHQFNYSIVIFLQYTWESGLIELSFLRTLFCFVITSAWFIIFSLCLWL